MLPKLNELGDEVDRIKIRGQQPRHLQTRTRLWLRSADSRFYRVELVAPSTGDLYGMTVLEVDRDFRLAQRLDAQRAHWTPRGWDAQGRGLPEDLARRPGGDDAVRGHHDRAAGDHRGLHGDPEAAVGHELPRAARVRGPAGGRGLPGRQVPRRSLRQALVAPREPHHGADRHPLRAAVSPGRSPLRHRAWPSPSWRAISWWTGRPSPSRARSCFRPCSGPGRRTSSSWASAPRSSSAPGPE